MSVVVIKRFKDEVCTVEKVVSSFLDAVPFVDKIIRDGDCYEATEMSVNA